MYLIGSIGLFPQSAVTLYIYRVGKTYPARNPVYRSKSIKISSCTRTLPGPVGPCRTGHNALTGQTARSYRSDRLVPILAVNICPPYFLVSLQAKKQRTEFMQYITRA